eukprot:7309800-Lingulodinium_polyedra.AAC.1
MAAAPTSNSQKSPSPMSPATKGCNSTRPSSRASAMAASRATAWHAASSSCKSIRNSDATGMARTSSHSRDLAKSPRSSMRRFRCTKRKGGLPARVRTSRAPTWSSGQMSSATRNARSLTRSSLASSRAAMRVHVSMA